MTTYVALPQDWFSVVGIVLMIFGPIIYPILGYFLGHTYPRTPTFGLPCPTTIFTVGALLLANRLPLYIIIIPLLWSVFGFSAAVSLGVKEDTALIIAGLIEVIAVIIKRAKVTKKTDSNTPSLLQ